MIIFRRHNKLSFSTYIGKCQEIRSESGFSCARLNFHIWRCSLGKLLPSWKLKFLSLVNYTWDIWNILCTSIGAWVWALSDVFSDLSSSMHSLCAPAESANPWLNACNTPLSGRLLYFISFGAPCIVSVPQSETVLLQALWLPGPWSLRSSNRRSGSREQSALCHSHGVNHTSFFFPGRFLCFPPGSFAQPWVSWPLSQQGGRTVLHRPRLLQSTGCSSHCKCATPSHRHIFLHGTARPVLGGGRRQTPSPLQLSATALPGMSSHLQVLTPIVGPQAYHVLTCSEIDVRRCVL